MWVFKSDVFGLCSVRIGIFGMGRNSFKVNWKLDWKVKLKG